MRKRKCEIPCASQFNKLVTFLRAPDEFTDTQEIETRDWAEWSGAGKSYAAIHTTGSRAVNIANQSHEQVDSVVECPWNGTTRLIDHTCAIRRTDIDGTFLYRQVVAAINVDEQNRMMRFICRTTSPNGVQDE